MCCCRCVLLSRVSVGSLVLPTLTASPGVKMVLGQRDVLEKQHDALQQKLLIHRKSIIAKFQQLRNALDSSERAALDEYDGHVKAILKQAVVATNSLQVLAEQAVPIFDCVIAPTPVQSGIQQTFVTCEVVDNTLEYLIANCWAITNHCSNDANAIHAMSAETAHVSIFPKFAKTVATQIKANEESITLLQIQAWKHCEKNCSPHFKGILRANFNLPSSKYCGIAVNFNGTIMAITNSVSGTVTFHSLPFGTVTHSLGQECIRKTDPFRIVFAHGSKTNNIIVTENSFRKVRLTEVDIVKKVVVRYVGDNVFTGPVSDVDCNSEFIVACQYSAVIVFDYETGNPVRRFGVVGARSNELADCASLRICPDGHCVMIGQRENRRVSMFSLRTGKFLRIMPIDNNTSSYPVGLGFWKNDVMCCVTRNNVLSLVTVDCPTKILKSITMMTNKLWTRDVVVSNGRIFVLHDNCVQVLE